jgi:hypothetical protein
MHANGEVPTTMPPTAAHERDRKKAMKPPVGIRGRQSSVRITKPSKVSVNTRLSEFPDQGFRNSSGSLFCGPCHHQVMNIKSTIIAHCATGE